MDGPSVRSVGDLAAIAIFAAAFAVLVVSLWAIGRIS